MKILEELEGHDHAHDDKDDIISKACILEILNKIGMRRTLMNRMLKKLNFQDDKMIKSKL